MPCIHGLDENNCPTCRIIKSTTPMDSKIRDLYSKDLKPENPFIKQNSAEKEEFINELIPKTTNLNPNSITTIPKPKILNDLPNFENKMFQERLKEIDVTKSDAFSISKKVPLESPEWKFKEKK